MTSPMKTRTRRQVTNTLAVLILCAGLCLPGRPARAESLAQVVDQVLQRHPDIQSSQALLQASGERQRQARSSFYPSAGLEAVWGEARDRDILGNRDRSTRRTDAYLRWNLYRGSADRHNLRMTEAENQAAQDDLADAHETVALEVATNYLEVLRLRQRLALAQSYLRENQRLTEVVAKRVQAGKAPPSELDQARMSVADGQWQVSRLQGQLAGEEARYSLLAGHPPAGTLAEPELPEVLENRPFQEGTDQIREANPRVRAALARARARIEEVGVAAGSLYPEINLDLRKRLQSDINPDPVTDTRDNAQLLFTYDVPLGGGNLSRRREALARQDAARAEAESLLLEVLINLGQARAAREEARRIAPELATRSASGLRVVNAYDLQFMAGRRSLQDLIGARADHHRALADEADNRHALALGTIQILQLQGRLRTSLLNPTAPAPTPSTEHP